MPKTTLPSRSAHRQEDTWDAATVPAVDGSTSGNPKAEDSKHTDGS